MSKEIYEFTIDKDTDDYYLDYNNSLKRLMDKYNKYGKIIIAYDFDDTINDYHNKGRKYDKVINVLKAMKPYAKFICYSNSNEDRCKEIKKYINDNNIPMDKLNEGFEGTPNGVKLYYNILLDDRSGLMESCSLLYDLYDYIKEKENK